MTIEQNMSIKMSPIGVVHTTFVSTNGAPIQPAFAKGSEGVVEVYSEYAEALLDLEGFERIWLLCWLDRASAFEPKIKPYLDSKLHGLFATRAPSRPNPIGMSCVKLLSVEANIVRVSEVDILDGTPLLDIKPYVGKFDCFEVKRNGWLDTADTADTQSDDRFYNDRKSAGGER